MKIHCFFSGGRDSAVACYIAKRVADVRNWEFVLVHIDTTIGLRETEEYVRLYAEWLGGGSTYHALKRGAELVVLRPDLTFEEYVAKYPYWPHIYPPWMRWCYHKLKRRPAERYIKQHYRPGDLIALGIRGDESLFRELNYDNVFTMKYYSEAKIWARLWLPLLYVDNETVEKLVKKFGIPESPVWRKIGSSGECFCLAATTERKVIQAVKAYPELAERLMKIDDIIHQHRKKGESYPIFLKKKRIRLKVWLQEIMSRPTLLEFDRYVGKACQGSCII
jgi:3'-phosphoadenosine 5'-phosphosulfate sulfotransferase (PAPS reductase)/FAD synthetase